jgi:hypothetical protein
VSGTGRAARAAERAYRMKGILVAAALGLALTACAGSRAPAQEPSATPTASTAPSAAQAGAPIAPDPKAASASGEQTLQGELVDLTCYLDHGAKGEHHKACATTCALKGLPIGLLGKDGTLTLVVGAHEKPMNTELADKMGTTVQVTGKVVSRNGMQMIEVSRAQ